MIVAVTVLLPVSITEMPPTALAMYTVLPSVLAAAPCGWVPAGIVAAVVFALRSYAVTLLLMPLAT